MYVCCIFRAFVMLINVNGTWITEPTAGFITNDRLSAVKQHTRKLFTIYIHIILFNTFFFLIFPFFQSTLLIMLLTFTPHLQWSIPDLMHWNNLPSPWYMMVQENNNISVVKNAKASIDSAVLWLSFWREKLLPHNPHFFIN